MQALTSSSHAIYRAQRNDITTAFNKWAASDDADHIAFSNRIYEKFAACFTSLTLGEWSACMLGIYCVVKYSFPMDQAIEIMECDCYLGSLYLAKRLNSPSMLRLNDAKFALVCAAYDLVSKDLELILHQSAAAAPAVSDVVTPAPSNQKKKKRDAAPTVAVDPIAADASVADGSEDPVPKKRKGGRKSTRTPEEKKQKQRENGKRYREKKKAEKEAEKSASKNDEDSQLKKALDDEIASAESKSNSPDAVSKADEADEEEPSSAVAPAPAAAVVSLAGANDQAMPDSAPVLPTPPPPPAATAPAVTPAPETKQPVEAPAPSVQVDSQPVVATATPTPAPTASVPVKSKTSAPSTPVSKPAPAPAITSDPAKNDKKKDQNHVDIDLEPSSEDEFPDDEENEPSPAKQTPAAVGMDRILLASKSPERAPTGTPQRPAAQLTLPDRITKINGIRFDKEKNQYVVAVVKGNNSYDQTATLASVPQPMVLDFLIDYRSRLDEIQIPTDPSIRNAPVISGIGFKSGQIVIDEKHMTSGGPRSARNVPPQQFPPNSRRYIVEFCETIKRQMK